MTSQTSRYLELSDFLTMKLTCKGCGSALEIPISRNMSGREDIQKVVACPICLKPWVNLGSSTHQPVVVGFPIVLKKLADALEAAAIGFPLTITVTGEDEKDSKP